MSLTKEERKKKFVAYAEKFPINDIPGISTLVSEEHTFVKVSKLALVMTGFSSEDEIYDKKYYDMKSNSSRCHEIWEKDEEIALKEKKVIRIISYASFNNGWKILLGHQQPLIDKETNHTLGLVNNFIDITENSFLDVGRLILMENNGLKRKQFQYKIQDNVGFEGLTKREQEVLFWYNHGVNSIGISRRLSKPDRPITSSTVRSYLEKIKLKLGVTTKEQLLEKSISIGFMCTVPESLFID